MKKCQENRKRFCLGKKNFFLKNLLILNLKYCIIKNHSFLFFVSFFFKNDSSGFPMQCLLVQGANPNQVGRNLLRLACQLTSVQS